MSDNMSEDSKRVHRIMKVLDRIKKQVLDSDDDAKMYEEALDNFLNELQWQDVFGTEGQNDPRGDFRNGKWSMKNIEEDVPPKPKCSVCGTTENVRYMGGHQPWLCPSPDCIPF